MKIANFSIHYPKICLDKQGHYNSEYGNLTFKEKRAKFNAYKDGNQHLKMSLIYANETWGDDKCVKHLNEIKEKIKKYAGCLE